MTLSRVTDVLVVDDDEAVRLALCRAFIRMGLTCDTAIDGRDALEQIAGTRYQVVLADLMMPRVDGAALVQELGKPGRAAGDRPVVVIITAFPDSELLAPLAESVQAILRKPLEVTELSEIVHACVQARRAHETAVEPAAAGDAHLSVFGEPPLRTDAQPAVDGPPATESSTPLEALPE